MVASQCPSLDQERSICICITSILGPKKNEHPLVCFWRCSLTRAEIRHYGATKGDLRRC